MKKCLLYILCFYCSSCVTTKNNISVHSDERKNSNEKNSNNENLVFSNIELLISSYPYRISETCTSLYKVNLIKFYKNGEFKMLSIDSELEIEQYTHIDSIFDMSGTYIYNGKEIKFSIESYVDVTDLNTGIVSKEKYICDYQIRYSNINEVDDILLKSRYYSNNWKGDFPWSDFTYRIVR